MAKLDLKKELRQLYLPSATAVSLVDVPELWFAMIDGSGDPNGSPAFEAAVGALYAVSFTAKFLVKAEQARDYVVMPLEGLWWMEDMAQFSLDRKDEWLWTLMILQPDYVTPEVFEQALGQARRKRDNPALAEVRFEAFHEGLSAQIMHLGPYSEEGPTVARLHAFIAEQGYRPHGKHHEIYLGDPRRCAPDKLKTILRQPVTR